ncbi:MBL fold metallo-hydrolase [Candidatus Woesearchaeota archaeon]|nr:MBL fold metallo-hydrolase [Candidatus Woesearchaeota archaeon]
MVNIKRLGHSSFKIDYGGFIIYIDPYKINRDETADMVLVTHSHFDHCSPDDIDKVAGPNTWIICPGDCEQKLIGNIKVMRPFARAEHLGTIIETVPAYNIDKEFHPKSSGWLGYIIERSGTRIYHAGDTDLIPEMEQLKDIDYALLPVGGIYTMDARLAAKAATIIKPKIAIPMHYGSVVGCDSDAETFKNLCRCDVKIM